MSPDLQALLERAKAVLSRQEELLSRAKQINEKTAAVIAQAKLSADSLAGGRPRLTLELPPPKPPPPSTSQSKDIQDDGGRQVAAS